jgi:hypothetical protein
MLLMVDWWTSRLSPCSWPELTLGHSRLTVSPWTGPSWLYSSTVHADHILGCRSQNRTDRVFNSVCHVTEWTLLFALGECQVLPWPWDRVHYVRDRVICVPQIVDFVLSIVDRAYSILAVALLGTVSSLSLAPWPWERVHSVPDS